MKLIFTGKNNDINGCFEHKHPSYEIVAVKNGECVTVAEKHSFHMQKYSLLIIPPNTNHKTVSDSKFSDLFLQTDSLPFRAEKTMQINDYSGNLLRLAETIRSLQINGTHAKNANELFLIFLNLLSEFSSDDKQNELTIKLKNIIEKKFTDVDFSISCECEKLGYNQDYLRRLFKKDFRVAPTQYLNSLSLEYAEKLIRNTNFAINAVAIQCGFIDPYYFSRAFAKRFGVSPAKYRQNNSGTRYAKAAYRDD